MELTGEDAKDGDDVPDNDSQKVGQERLQDVLQGLLVLVLPGGITARSLEAAN